MSEQEIQPPVWFITGVSSGIGRALAEAALQRGDCVVGTFRQPAQLAAFEALAPARALAVQVDVTDSDAIRRGVTAAVARFGRIDVLVNNAGYALLSSIEEASEAEIRQQMDANFFGAVNMTRAVLPTLRAQRSGYIINVSSEGGFLSAAGWGLYSASKYALEGFSEALAQEVAPFGIRVTVVESGAMATNLEKNTRTINQRIADYDLVCGNSPVWDFSGGVAWNFVAPQRVAAVILTLPDLPEAPLHLALSKEAAAMIRMRLQTLVEQMDKWQHVTESL